VTKEVWKEVRDSEGLYFVSNLGRTKSFHPRFYNMAGKVKTRSFKVYAEMFIRVPGRKLIRVSVHRAVWEAFMGPIPIGLVINHKDGVKSNNSLSNLEVVTPGGNLKHAYDTGLRTKKFGAGNHRAKLSSNQIIQIRELLREGISQSKIGKLYGVHQCTISDIKNRVTGY